MLKKTLLFLAICYTLALAVFSLITINDLPKLNTKYDDKIFHVLAYGLLVIVWYFTLRRLRKLTSIFIIAILSIFYGIIIEVFQGQFTMTRQLDIFDILANCLGVLIPTLFIIIRNRIIVKN